MKITHYFKTNCDLTDSQLDESMAESCGISESMVCNCSTKNLVAVRELATPLRVNIANGITNETTRKSSTTKRKPSCEVLKKNTKLSKTTTIDNSYIAGDENSKPKKIILSKCESASTNKENTVATTPNKKQKVQSLNAFFSPMKAQNISSAGTTSTSTATDPSDVAMTDEERKTKMVQNGTKRVEKALLSLNRDSFIKGIATMSRLPDRYLALVPNSFVKYALQKEINLQKRAAIMKNMTRSERAAYKINNALEIDQKYDILLEKFLIENYEDMALNLKEFCEIPSIPLPDTSATFEEFEKCLQITEFISAHADLLGASQDVHIFSAEILHNFLYSSKEGFESCVGHILKLLSWFLVDDGYKKDSGKLKNFANLTKMRNNVHGVLKLAKLLLLDVDSVACTRSSARFDDGEADEEEDSFLEMNDSLREALNAFKDAFEFYHLEPVHQLEIILCLVNKILMRESFSKFICDINYLTSAVQDLKDIEAELAEVKKELREIPPPLSEEELINASRRESAEDAKNEKLRMRKVDEFEKIHEEFENQSIIVKELKEIDRLRIVQLGTDRFYRKYWYFKNSPNRGVFVEESKNGSSESESIVEMKGRRKSKSSEDFTAILEESVCGKPPPEFTNVVKQWRKIDSKELLDSLLDCLCEKGLREGELKKKILHMRSNIVNSF